MGSFRCGEKYLRDDCIVKGWEEDIPGKGVRGERRVCYKWQVTQYV